MKRVKRDHHRWLTSLAIIFFCTLAVASAQQPDDGTFYFPPRFTLSTADPSSQPEDTDAPQGITVTEYHLYHTAPLLPMIFFDAGKPQPADRYSLFFNSLQTDTYTDSTGVDAWSAPDMQHDVLNIIGYRMRKFPSATVVLEGGYSTEPGETSELADERAESVKEYLVNIWKMEPERITFLPVRQMCDSSGSIFRQEEARCVILHPDNTGLIRSVRYRGIAINAPGVDLAITVDPRTATPGEVASIEIIIRRNDTVLSSTKIPGSSDSTLYRLQGKWAANRDQLINAEALEAYAIITLQNGTTRSSNGVRIPIIIDVTPIDQTEQNTPDAFTITLPFFPSGRSELSPLQRSLLSDMLQSALTDSSSIKNDIPFDITISGEGEASEDQTAENGVLFGRWSDYNSISQTLRMSQQSRPNERPILLKNPDGTFPDYNTWYYGTPVPGIYDQYRERKALASTVLTNQALELMDSLTISRARETTNYLTTYVEDGTFADISILSITDLAEKTSTDTAGANASSFYFSPEERFYNRSVTINGHRHYESDPQAPEESEGYEMND